MYVLIDFLVECFEKLLKVPNGNLKGVKCIILKRGSDFDKIPKKGGCYWIWTNENIVHSFHSNSLIFPKKFEGGEVIYNGISKDDIRGRIKKHLFGNVSEGMSGISIDLLLYHHTDSHRKKALSANGRTAFCNNVRIRTKNSLLNLNLSQQEIDFVNLNNHDFHFRNGINITEPKHNAFTYKVFYVSGLTSASYTDFIEKKWREKYGLPRLCTYSKGR